MDFSRSAWTDQKIEQIIGDLLRVGVLVAAAVALAGGSLYLIQQGGAPPDFTTFTGEPKGLRSLIGILSAAFSLDSRGIIQLGLLILIATPIARVVLSVFAFALLRDRLYVFVTLIVLAVLLFSLSGGRF